MKRDDAMTATGEQSSNRTCRDSRPGRVMAYPARRFTEGLRDMTTQHGEDGR